MICASAEAVIVSENVGNIHPVAKALADTESETPTSGSC